MGEIEDMIKKMIAPGTEPVLVAVWDMDETRIHDTGLLEKWKGPKELVMGPEREDETEDDSGHYVLRIYRNNHGYWLYKSWISHIGYSWEEDRLYFLPVFPG